jgi:endonuclease YncB( thermonuclease family)
VSMQLIGIAVRIRSTGAAAVVLLSILFSVPTSARAQAWIGPAYVTRVAEGNLIYAEVGGRMVSIRYAGVHVPIVDHPTLGREPYASAARQENQQLVEGKWIYLLPGTPSSDRFGRFLAYVWVDNRLVNATLVRRGFVEATADPHHYLTYFRELEEGARRDGRGLWGNADVLAYYRPAEADVDTGQYRGRPPDGSGGRVFSGFLPPIQPLPPGTPSAPASAPAIAPPSRTSGPGTYPTLPYDTFPEPGTTYFPVPGGR